MKRDFSYYEFAGLLVPGCITLFGLNSFIDFIYQKKIVDFEKIGETVVFLIICYGTGHLLQSIGNLFEQFLWLLYGGMPTKWLNHKNNFGDFLFEPVLNKKILDKVEQGFGTGLNDYGKLIYNSLYQAGKTQRIDIFNGNYSLFRGLVVSFLLLAIACCYFFDWKISLFSFIPFLLMTMRMIRFAKHYATELFRTFYLQKEI